jgi:molecular chaperone IbpA
MTQIGQISFGPLLNSTLGFERFITDVEKIFEASKSGKPVSTTYPPHNIIKLDDNKYAVELAIAGFKIEDIEIFVEDGELIIKGDKKDTVDEPKYVYRGIATRSFTKIIQMADTVEVRNASFEDGILRINLENVIPDNKKPRKIEIGKQSPTNKKDLLNE